MRAVIQRVRRASVTVDGTVASHIDAGLAVFLCAMQGDGENDIQRMAEKIAYLRIFEDENGKMNRSVLDIGGAVLLVSQFTLAGDARHGRRPNFSGAAGPDIAAEYMDACAKTLRSYGIEVQTGVFRAHMDVELVNNGPVTILLDTGKVF